MQNPYNLCFWDNQKKLHLRVESANYLLVCLKKLNLYGEGEDERRFVPYLRKQFANGEVAQLTSGNQVRDF